jgi:hypothetical protein
MKQSEAIILLIIFIIGIYCVIQYNKSSTQSALEKFVALSGLNPLTTFDDYGTLNHLMHFDDFPFYDPSYENLLYKYKDIPPGSDSIKNIGSINYPRDNIEDFSKDSFLYSEGRMTRRELVPSNYVEHPEFADADFDQRVQNYTLINTAREARSSVPPWPHNVYFAK